MILCIGSTSSGKTLLLKRLQTRCQFETSNYLDVPNTVATVGTNIVNVRTIANNVMTIVEVGGAMTLLWNQYFNNYADLEAVIYVIDCTNVSKVSQSAITLVNLFSNINLENVKPLMIVLNKVDVSCSSTISEMRYFLMIDSFIDSLPNNRIEVVETSCVTGKGLPAIIDWIQSFQK